jgi:hypothetical protein
MLASATRLAHPAQAAKLSLAVDASATHIGACLQQKRAGSPGWEPLGFFSKKLESAQVKYSAFDNKLLACFLEKTQLAQATLARGIGSLELILSSSVRRTSPMAPSESIVSSLEEFSSSGLSLGCSFLQALFSAILAEGAIGEVLRTEE